MGGLIELDDAQVAANEMLSSLVCVDKRLLCPDLEKLLVAMELEVTMRDAEAE